MKLDRSKLIRAREMLGYGVEKTAEEAGVSKNSVLRAEHEEDIRPVTARKIAAALEVRVADLLGKAQDPLLDSEDERRKSVYRFTGGPRVTVEQLRERGIDANESEAHVLNQYLEIHERPPTGPVSVWHVKREDEPVDHERVKTMLAFVLASGMLTTDETQAVLKAVHRELAGTRS